MVVSQELYLRVSKGIFGGSTERYGIGESVTVLTKQNDILRGEIMNINCKSFSISVDNKETVISFNDISNIANMIG